MNEETVYHGSANCPKCGSLMTPIEAAFSGGSKLCPECRNAMYRKNAKQAMAGGSRGER